MVEVENGGDDVGGVERVFEEDLVAYSNVADLVGGDVGEDIGLEPAEGCGLVGIGQEGEEFVRHANRKVDSGTGEGFEGGGVNVEEADVFDAIGFDEVDNEGGLW